MGAMAPRARELCLAEDTSDASDTSEETPFVFRL